MKSTVIFYILLANQKSDIYLQNGIIKNMNSEMSNVEVGYMSVGYLLYLVLNFFEVGMGPDIKSRPNKVGVSRRNFSACRANLGGCRPK